ncbi:MAG: Cyanophycinase-like protein [Bacteroidetes bacterium]|jgi:cyanophycinase|nr:Cyanophycinase-like protein [Bacteroidota bacterium]
MNLSRTVFPIVVVLALLAGQCAPPTAAGETRGHLVIIGGGERTEEIMKRFVDLAGGPEKARIIVIPLASGNAREAGESAVAEFTALGVNTVSWLLFSREEAAGGNVAGKLSSATGIYFTGGDQVRITRIIVGTPVHQALLQRYRDGAVIGGTSAGAAIMSKVMITGDELINKDTNTIFTSIMRGNVQTVEGLGFLDDVIVDQHFVKRKRLNRLISVVLEHPELPGIGIDESTALVANPNGVFEVMGEGTVVVFDARGASGIQSDTHGNLGARNVTMHVIRSGETFALTSLGPAAVPGNR